MNQDLNEIYRQTVQTCALFAACCQSRANYGLSEVALQASYPVVCRFLLEDTEGAANRAHVLNELLRSLNGLEMIKSEWQEYNEDNLRTLLVDCAPRVEQKMSDKHIKKMAQLWEFGQNIRYSSDTINSVAEKIGVKPEEFVALNKKLVSSDLIHYYKDFFDFTMEVWCERAKALHTQTSDVFAQINEESSLHMTKAKP